MLCVRPDRPIDPLTLAVMREVDKLVKELGLPYFLCGAMARDVMLQHVHGIDTGAATRDVDFGVATDVISRANEASDSRRNEASRSCGFCGFGRLDL